MKASGKKTLKLTWTEVKGAKGYDVFFRPCDGDDAELVDNVSTKKGGSYKFTRLEKNTGYKAYVWAWTEVDGGKVYIGEPSPIVHAATGNRADGMTNAAKVSVKPGKLKLAAGGSGKVEASVTGEKSKLEPLSHTSALRWYSSDRNVATVNGEGKVTARGEGSCSIYALANNGVRARVKVTVKGDPVKLSFGRRKYTVKRRKSLNLAQELTVIGDAGRLAWTSSDPKIAAVSAKGVVKGVKKGTVTITVTTRDGATARTKVQVK